MNAEAPPRRFDIRIDRELTHPQVLSLLDEHLAGMRAASPPECVFALDLDGLRRPQITFLTAWRLPADAAPGAAPEEVGELVAMGALKELTPTTATAGGHGELKSMRTSAPPHRPSACSRWTWPACASPRSPFSLRGGCRPTPRPALNPKKWANWSPWAPSRN